MSTFPATKIIAGTYPWFPSLVGSISVTVTFRITLFGTIRFSKTIVPASVLLPLTPVLSPSVNVPVWPVKLPLPTSGITISNVLSSSMPFLKTPTVCEAAFGLTKNIVDNTLPLLETLSPFSSVTITGPTTISVELVVIISDSVKPRPIICTLIFIPGAAASGLIKKLWNSFVVIVSSMSTESSKFLVVSE